MADLIPITTVFAQSNFKGVGDRTIDIDFQGESLMLPNGPGDKLYCSVDSAVIPYSFVTVDEKLYKNARIRIYPEGVEGLNPIFEDIIFPSGGYYSPESYNGVLHAYLRARGWYIPEVRDPSCPSIITCPAQYPINFSANIVKNSVVLELNNLNGSLPLGNAGEQQLLEDYHIDLDVVVNGVSLGIGKDLGLTPKAVQVQALPSFTDGVSLNIDNEVGSIVTNPYGLEGSSDISYQSYLADNTQSVRLGNILSDGIYIACQGNLQANSWNINNASNILAQVTIDNNDRAGGIITASKLTPVPIATSSRVLSKFSIRFLRVDRLIDDIQEDLQFLDGFCTVALTFYYVPGD